MKKVEESPSVAVVCASNNNRSMAAHYQCKEANIQVKSYGTGQQVKLPGKSITEQHVYDFGTPYEKMINDLKSNDEKYYTRSGLIPMLERNASLKLAPEKFQAAEEHFDVVLCYELRVFEQAVNHLMSLNGYIEGGFSKPCYLVNLNVVDNPTEAHSASIESLRLIKQLLGSRNWRDEFVGIVKEFTEETKNKYKIMHSILFA